MKVFIERSREEKDVTASSVKDVLEALSINPDTVLVMKNDVLVTEDESLVESDVLKILSVISGG